MRTQNHTPTGVIPKKILKAQRNFDKTIALIKHYIFLRIFRAIHCMFSIIALGELMILSSALPSHLEQGKAEKFAKGYSKCQGGND